MEEEIKKGSIKHKMQHKFLFSLLYNIKPHFPIASDVHSAKREAKARKNNKQSANLCSQDPLVLGWDAGLVGLEDEDMMKMLRD